jgi:LysR family hydrogen peroxide-inducible transcriptional activator
VIANLTRTHPELDIHVREALTSKLIEELAEGRLDAAIVALPVSEPSLTEVALFAEDFLLVRPGEDEGKPVPGSEALSEMRLLLLEEGHCFRDQALSFCSMQSSPPREVLDASSLSTLVQMVGAGMGVTLIPEMAVAVETRSAPVSVARFSEPPPSRTIGMVWRGTSPLAGQLLQLSEVVCRSTDNGVRASAPAKAGGHTRAAARAGERCQARRV